TGRLGGDRGHGARERLAQADDGRHVLGPRPAAAFLVPADLHRGERDPTAYPEKPHALGPADLVRRAGQQIDGELADAERTLSDRLHGVRVEGDSVAPAQLA